MKIVWSKKAENKLDIYFSYCRDNYGDKVTSDKIEKLAKITNRLSVFPEMGFPEPILVGERKLYRAVIFEKRLKIIYYVENEDIIRIVDLWDSKRSPENLKKEI